ncbi:hypothetical protein JOB18_038001 [Solea senegalensis]|uniref:Uncharacterized protein n=1 Tax=Solea senegalensis TaxID=28829 RepID=A0AAV6STT6_SOLSE|nr:hypothetical protein JOB18_038001 [Solea senegalensis]
MSIDFSRNTVSTEQLFLHCYRENKCKPNKCLKLQMSQCSHGVELIRCKMKMRFSDPVHRNRRGVVCESQLYAIRSLERDRRLCLFIFPSRYRHLISSTPLHCHLCEQSMTQPPALVQPSHR